MDVGDLIDGGAARPLFVLSTTDPLRVYVDVPQSYSQLVKVGQKVTVSQNELRGRAFEGQVVRTSGAIDPARLTDARVKGLTSYVQEFDGRMAAIA